MANDPGYGNKVTATVVSIKGHCQAGHQVGDTFEVSVLNTAGMCGLCYHRIFPHLATFQFDGEAPWWDGDEAFLECPDRKNLLTLKLERTAREEK